MKVTIKEREADDYGEGESFNLEIVNDKAQSISIDAGHGEPEDNYLFRDLSFVYDIEDMLKMAYEAGVAGEEFEVEKINLKSEE